MYYHQQRMVVRSGLSRSKEEVASELAPILEHETLELCDKTRSPAWHRHSAPCTPSMESLEERNSCSPATDTEASSDASRRHPTAAPIAEADRGRTQPSAALTDARILDVDHGDVDSGANLVLWKRQKISLNIEENLHALPL